jgi:hypothetical protein
MININPDLIDLIKIIGNLILAIGFFILGYKFGRRVQRIENNHKK